MAYYKRNECTAASADSPDCICWSPAEPPAAPVQQEPYSIVYDGDSLPMIAVGKRLYRAQEFVRGQWRTLDHPQLYKELFAHPSEDLRAELAEAKDANKARIAELEKRQAWLASVGPANHPDDERHFAMAFVRANERAEAAEQRVAALEAQIKAAPEGMVVSTRTLKFWREYWNGNYNELAMSNALDFLMGQFDDVIAAAGAQEGKAL